MAGRHRKPSPLHRAHHRGRHRKPPTPSQAVVPAVLIVGVLTAGGVAFGHALANGQPPGAGGVSVVPPAPTAILTPAVAVPSPTATPSAVPSPTRAPSRSASHHAAAAAFVLTDRGGACYLEVKNAAGHLLVRRTLHHGQRVTVRQHGLHVVIGNAGAAWISLGGHPAHRAGRAGQVAKLHVH